MREKAVNTKGGCITIPLTSCLTGLDYSVLQINTKNVSHTADSKPVKQEVNGTAIPLQYSLEKGQECANKTEESERERSKAKLVQKSTKVLKKKTRVSSFEF